MKKFGIDISRWQGDFDFDKAIAEGIEFAIIKGGGGDAGLYKDVKFERNYSQAKAKSLPIGCYWFSRALSIEEAEKEAQYFYDYILKNKQFELPIYIDVEHKSMLNLGKEKLTEIIITFCEKLEKLGYFVGVYSSKSYFDTYMNDIKLQRFAHWVAQWAKECTYNGEENVLGMWQFGGETNLIRTNKVAGVTCDQNYMLLDYPSIIKSAGLNGFSKTETPHTKKTVDELAKEVIAGKWGIGMERREKMTSAGYDYTEVQKRVNDIMSTKMNNSIQEGDMVKLSNDGVVYGTNTKFAKFVYNSILYVRELNGNRAVISTEQEGKITGAVDIKYLQKI